MIIKPPLTQARHYAMMLAFCLSVSSSVTCVHKNALFSKAIHFRAMVSIEDY